MSPFAQPGPMVRLLTADDAFAAKVVAARLGVEGIVWELRGGVDGPYPIGPVHVFVPEDDLAEARALMASTEPLDEDVDDDESDDERLDRRAMLAGGGALVVLSLGAAELVRLLALR